MKLILCTLSICLSILASVFTTKELVRAEGKKIRSSIPKALTEPVEAAGRAESLIQKLDAITAQLGSLSRRLTSLEDTYARQNPLLAPLGPAGSAPGLNKTAVSLGATLARLDAIPDQLDNITTYLDESFEHLENTVTETTAPQRVTDALDPMAKKIDAIDNYFTPLYKFLGLVYDPANADLLADYPSVDVRLNELSLQIEAMHQDLAELRVFVTPYNIEPTKHPR